MAAAYHYLGCFPGSCKPSAWFVATCYMFRLKWRTTSPSESNKPQCEDSSPTRQSCPTRLQTALAPELDTDRYFLTSQTHVASWPCQGFHLHLRQEWKSHPGSLWLWLRPRRNRRRSRMKDTMSWWIRTVEYQRSFVLHNWVARMESWLVHWCLSWCLMDYSQIIVYTEWIVIVDDYNQATFYLHVDDHTALGNDWDGATIR